jgi:hypothetical protein
VKANTKPVRKRGRPGRPSLQEIKEETEDEFVTVNPTQPGYYTLGLENELDDGKPSKSKIFYGSQDQRGDIDHVDQVLDHAKFVAGTDILYEDWKSYTPEKRKELLDVLIEDEKQAQIRVNQAQLGMSSVICLV